MLKKKKAFVFFIVFSLLCGLYFFRGPLFSLSFKIACTRSFPSIWKSDLSIDKIALKKGGMQLSMVTLSMPNDFDLLIDKVEIDYHFDGKMGIFNPRFHFHRPRLFLKEIQNASKKKKNAPKKIMTFLSKCQIDNGQVHFISEKQQEIFSPYYFSFVGKNFSSPSGTLYLSSHADEKSPELILDLVVRNEKLNIDLKLEDFKAQMISDLFAFYSSSLSFGTWSGIFRGAFFFDFQLASGVFSGGGGGTLTDFQYSNISKGLFFKTKKIDSHLFFENEEGRPWWECIFLSGNLDRSSLEIKRDEPIEIKQLAGRFHLNFTQDPLLELSGEITHLNENFPFCLKGQAIHAQGENFDFRMNVSLLDNKENLTELSADCLFQDEAAQFKIEGIGLDYQKFRLLQRGLKKYFDPLKNVSLKQGSLDFTICLDVQKKDMHSMQIPHFEGKNILLDIPYKKMSVSADHVRGKLEEGNIWDISFKDASLKKEDLGIVIDRIEGEISLRENRFEHSYLTGFWGRMKLGTQISGTLPYLEAKVSLSSTLPNFFNWTSLNNIPYEQAEIDLTLCFLENQIDVKGNFLATENADTFAFGFLLDKATFNQSFDIRHIFPHMSKGWFNGKNMRTSIFRPLLKELNFPWEISGTYAFEGTFDPHFLDINMSCPHLGFTSDFAKLSAHLKDGHFMVDFREKTWKGKVNLDDGHFFDPKTHLTFDSVRGNVDIDFEKISTNGLFAVCKGMSLCGDLDILYKKEEKTLLNVFVYRIDGTTEQLKQFLHEFHIFEEHDIPLNAKVKEGENGFHLSCIFTPGKNDVKWDAHLTFKEGSYVLTPWVSLENLQFDLNFSSREAQMNIEHILGSLQLKFKEKKEYGIKVPYLTLKKHGMLVDFDFRLISQTHDILRLVAKSEKLGELQFEKELCHFFGSKLAIQKYIFDEEFHLKECSIESTISAHELLSQMQFLLESGILPLKNFRDFRSLDLEGEINMAFSLLAESKRLSFHAQGKQLFFNSHPLTSLFLDLSKEDKAWKVKGNFEPLHFFAEGIENEGDWKIPQFQVDWKKNHVTFDEGKFSKEDHLLSFNISDLRFFPEELKKWLPQQVLTYLDGQFDAHGSSKWKIHGLNDWEGSIEMNIRSDSFGKGEFSLASSKAFFLEFSSDLLLKIKDLHFLINAVNPGPAHLQIKEINYDFKNAVWMGDRLNVSIPPEFLHFLYRTSSLPFLSNEDEKNILFESIAQWDNHTEFEISFEADSKLRYLTGQLKSGYYWMGNHSWLLDGFQFALTGDLLDVEFKTKFQDILFKVQAHTDVGNDFYTHLTFQELTEAPDPGVHLEGSWNTEKGISISKINGDLWGLQIAFLPNAKISHPGIFMLTGGIKIDAKKLSKILPKTHQEFIKQLGIGAGYEIHGDAMIMRDNPSHSYFKGYLKGKDFDLIEYHLNTLLAELSFNHRSLLLNDLNISDDAGIMKIQEMKFSKESDDRWHMQIPEILLQDFRPSLLKKGRSRERMKPFIIRDLIFSDIQGYLGEKESFSGRGHLSFINTFKQDMNIIDIPLEIISRLGLDMGLLIPVKGDLDYEIRQGKIFLTELRHAVSEGKRSHFYLSKTKPSYVEFDGSIHVDVKMKQYVLLKITEPFTLSLRGNLLSPRFGLK